MVARGNRKILIICTLFLVISNASTQKYYVPKVSTTPEPSTPDFTTIPLTPEDVQDEYVGPEDVQNEEFGQDDLLPDDDQGEYAGPEDEQGKFESDSRSLGQSENDSANSEQDGDDESESAMSTDMAAPEFTSKRFFKLNDKMTIFNELLDKEIDPKGYPFPEIHGPAPWERVCIVGAGPAGVHMSLSLKKMGYKNVTIFEKTARVGGKAYDVNMVSGSYLPQGAFSFSSESFKTLVALAEEYGIGEYERIPEFGVG